MVATQLLLLPLLGSAASAANLWATHYLGTINYLTFRDSSLSLTRSSSTGNKLPSWITYDAASKALYIPDEVFYGASGGNLASFAVGNNGTLKDAGKGSTPLGAVATALYGGADGKGFIVNAHYQSSQLSTFKLPLNGGQPLQTVKFTLSGPGTVPSRQDAPHPHHVVVDPTGDFLIVPDLGADLLRIFRINKTSGLLTECPAAQPAPGTGPRHAAFWTPGSTRHRRAAEGTTLFVANELKNTVSSWTASYPSGGCLTLSLKQSLTPYQGNSSAPAGTKLGEIKVKGNFLYTSNRNDKKFSPNDSMTQYTIASDGSLTWTENTSSYGTYPRTFDINKAGDYVAIGDQTTANVAIVARDTATGKLGKRVADLRVGSVGVPENEDVICLSESHTHSYTMKTDNYLNLCLEQATNSPLRYRHGAIVVRGGKVIGQGYNDYRSGFDGGALKTGRRPLRSSDAATMAEPKKQKLKQKPDMESIATDTFTPFEQTNGRGKLVNTPLSMHAEMMAIHSALSVSSALASSTVSSEKPCFKLSGDSKQKARLRRDAVKSYVETVCKAALAHGDSNNLHLNRALLKLAASSKEDDKDAALRAEKSTVFHHQKKEKKYHNAGNKHNNGHHQHHKQSAHERSLRNTSAAADCPSPDPGHVAVIRTDITSRVNTSRYKRNFQKERGIDKAVVAPASQPLLLPKGQTGHSSRAMRDRTRHARLNGADIYVVRLGRKGLSTDNEPKRCCTHSTDVVDVPPLPSITGSLHDELIHPKMKPAQPASKSTVSNDAIPPLLTSRPCYRCVSYMASVGIRRVFWTTDTGKWESAKIRELVDTLDNLWQDPHLDAATTINSLFVTKHEVLMLRRTMDSS
ncbi:3-carboxy-cis,cis-mucoante lactonizing enzyme [Plenodomus tracheiphilus IPT5]|uniref:3-carboxy-cis,cis-mucoante lactonizing enzyme n=1 Tax=Plenodomus tracheiphilus IPT5 TaxID=1408161 RepID=A0A6A7BAT3_9PLEO|nr:3-carboxy-cis,cis-mucoante lactonizing enzyme [Plenodomus tracheiphilus IPT5]